MNAIRRGTVCLTLSLMLCAAGPLAADEGAAPAPAEPGGANAVTEAAEAGRADAAEADAELEGPVQMVMLTLGNRVLRGRLVFEDGELIKVEPVGGGVTGYRKDSVSEIRRFTMTWRAYYEQRGDYHRERVWKTEDPPAELIKARQGYQQALAYSTGEGESARLRAKLAAVAADRDEWQRELVRKEEVARARHKTELAKLEKELTQEKLLALQRQDREIRDLAVALRETQEQSRYLLGLIEGLDRKVEDLDDEVDRLRHLDRTFIRNTIFLDLKRSHVQLERDVRRLERRRGSN